MYNEKYTRFCTYVQYSMQQKECLTTLDEKSSVFLTVNLYKILHASTYDIYEYMFKIKNLPRLVRGHQPPRTAADYIGSRAHYNYALYRRKERLI